MLICRVVKAYGSPGEKGVTRYTVPGIPRFMYEVGEVSFTSVLL